MLAIAVLLLGVAFVVALVVWLVQRFYFSRRRRGSSWWPVRPQTVGPKMWRFVRPRSVAIAVFLQVAVIIWIFFPPPWSSGFDVWFCGLAYLGGLVWLYRLEVPGMREGWTRYRSRSDDHPGAE